MERSEIWGRRHVRSRISLCSSGLRCADMHFRQRRSLIAAVDVGYSSEIGLQKSSDNGSETVDLGIKGRRAIVCASSKGLGRACAMALANEGVHVTLTPIELIKATVDGMMAGKFGRIVNITSSAVKAPIEVLGLSNGARAGLTGFVAGIARKTVINNVTINALLPGPFDTDRLRGPVAKMDAEKRGITVDQLIAERGKTNPAGRVGDPEEFGLACAFLCGAKAGFITGQNILLDGGAFPGTF